MTRRLVSWGLLALFLVAWAFTLRPVALGGPATFVVVTGQSMEPTYHDGDFVVLRAQDTYAEGDIVSFPVPEGEPGAGALIIHRIIGGTHDAFTIQGDNNDHVDEWTPSESDVLGAEWFAVPHAGAFLQKLSDPTLLAALAGGIVTVMVFLRPAKPTAGGRPDQEIEDGSAPTLEGGQSTDTAVSAHA